MNAVRCPTDSTRRKSELDAWITEVHGPLVEPPHHRAFTTHVERFAESPGRQGAGVKSKKTFDPSADHCGRYPAFRL